MKLQYKIASTPSEYEDAYELCSAEGIDLTGHKLEHPTALAYEGPECVGLCSCYVEEDMIICGPLVLRSDIRRPITALRLCEKFEAALTQIGIKTYIIRADKDSIIHDAIPRFTPDMKCYHDDGFNKFYIRRIGGDNGSP